MAPKDRGGDEIAEEGKRGENRRGEVDGEERRREGKEMARDLKRGDKRRWYLQEREMAARGKDKEEVIGRRRWRR